MGFCQCANGRSGWSVYPVPVTVNEARTGRWSRAAKQPIVLANRALHGCGRDFGGFVDDRSDGARESPRGRDRAAAGRLPVYDTPRRIAYRLA
jgi:hypothetical protein